MINEKGKLEGNILIAEFKGGVPTIIKVDGIHDYVEGYTLPLDYVDGTYYCKVQDLRYHSSWNDLIPVVKKMYALGYGVNINSGMRRIHISRNDTGLIADLPEYDEEFRGNSSLFEEYTDSECLWKAIIDFLEFYNDKTKS